MARNNRVKEKPYIRITLSNIWTTKGNYMGDILDKDIPYQSALIKADFFDKSKELREGLRLKVYGNRAGSMSFNLVANQNKLDQITDEILYNLPHVVDISRHSKRRVA